MSVNAGRKAKDAAMAAYMKQHPGQYPDSVMRPWRGEGAGYRDMARQMGAVSNNTSRWFVAMLGGLAAARLGYGSSGVPSDLLNDKRAA